MLRTRTIIALALAAFAAPALAGSPTFPPKKAASRTFSTDMNGAASASASQADGFTYAGGDTGWELKQHKYVLANGRFVHSNECDHAMRTAQTVTPADIESGRAMSPGG